jgi:hypothetical protein
VYLSDNLGYGSHRFIVYRVNWLRAKARYIRWEEEHNVVRHEMEWTVKYFQHREQQWEERRCAVSDERIAAGGLRCYAAKQAGLWRKFAESAKVRFKEQIPDVHIADL